MYQINGNRPSSGDPFYNTTGNGGYSQCIQGKPVVSGLNVLCNCVGAACGFFNKIYSEVTGYKGMKYPYLNCNAELFIKRANDYYPDIKIVQEPCEGGIMVWEGYGDLAGHVAGVVKCNSATQVYTAESGYNNFAWANYTRNKGSNGNYGLDTRYFKYLGCLVNPALGEQRSYQSAVTPNVPRDESKDQIEVKQGISELRVRSNPSLQGGILGLATPGFYNYYETAEADGYVWYRIADGQWIAYSKDWEIVYPKTEPQPVVLKYKVGDKMIFSGVLYGSAYGENPGQSRKDLVCTITMTYDKPGATKPYNINDGLGWVAEDDLTPYVEPTPAEIKLGDTVIVNGVGTASSTGEGARTRRYVNQEMKVIMISGNTSRPNRYALNQYNKGNVNDPSAVTGWFSGNDIKKK